MINDTESTVMATSLSISAALDELRRSGSVMAESMNIDKDGISLALHLRVSVCDLDASRMAGFFGFVTEKLVRTLRENAKLRERLAAEPKV